MPTRTSSAVWKGDLKSGSGSVKLASGAFEGQYSYVSRFEEGEGTNPEELISAAHAGCFSMALAAGLSRDGYKVNSINTTAAVVMGKTDAGNSIIRIDLVTKGDVEGIDEAKFKEAADAAKAGCPVSRALAALPITVDATLV